MTTGPLTIERHAELAQHGTHLHVFVHGEDVTRRCRFADDTPGHETAELYRLNVTGQGAIKISRNTLS